MARSDAPAAHRQMAELAVVAELRDEETVSHMERVSRYCAVLSELAGVGRERSELIAAASTMHDIGKLGISDRVLRKPGALDPAERRQIERHPDYGHTILAREDDPFLELAATIAWTHHERWDGGGYPRGLAGSAIPLAGRIVTIGDVFDALTSNRVYRPAMRVDQAVALMRAGQGTQFDPRLLDLFVDALPRMLAIRRRHADAGQPRRVGLVAS